MKLHVIGIANSGRLWHTIRDISRPALPSQWDPWEDVMAFAGDPGSRFIFADCAGVNDLLHVCAITNDGRLFHTIRFGSQSWQRWGNVGMENGLGNYEFVSIGVAGINDELHVCASANERPRGDGGDLRPASRYAIYHTIRYSNPPERWQSGGFHDVTNTTAGRPDLFISGGVDCANVNGLLHLCAKGTNGGLWHTIRDPQNPSQSWQPFQDIRPTQANNLGVIDEIGTSGIGGSLHVCAVANGNLWHTIRIDDTRWQPSWGDVRLTVDSTFRPSFRYVDCATVDGDLHVCAVTDGESIVHTIRISNIPDWQRVFGDVTAEVGRLGVNPSPFIRVSAAGI